MPYDGDNVPASTRRASNAGRPPATRYSCRMSGVFAKRFGRYVSFHSSSSATSSSSSQRVFFHVKYV